MSNGHGFTRLNPQRQNFDFAGWVSRARAFTIAVGRLPGAEVRSTTVAAPITESEMPAIERAIGATFPTSLRALFTRGAGAVDCAYVWEPESQALDQLRPLLPDETGIYGREEGESTTSAATS